ncbi:MAG: hypothetical protein RJQ21_06070, partial [Rhodospirillales bacterium]
HIYKSEYYFCNFLEEMFHVFQGSCEHREDDFRTETCRKDRPEITVSGSRSEAGSRRGKRDVLTRRTG